MGSSAAFDRLMALPDVVTVLDIGSGGGQHAKMMRAAGKKVTTISLIPPADYIGDYLSFPGDGFDAIWASHVLEHQPNVGAFLKKCFADLRDDGVFAVTVPPLKHAVVGGHLNLFNAGTLLYNLVVAGFDCSKARVGTYGYNISVIVRKRLADLPNLMFDAGDINKLAHFFPRPVGEGFDGQSYTANW
jgi:SAM-dependent methyltransferase